MHRVGARRIGSALALGCMCLLAAWAEAGGTRNVLKLDGQWQVAEGKLDQPPTAFDRKVPVPGLIDQATPPFEAPGSSVSQAERKNVGLRPADPKREAFWYRRTFQLSNQVPPVALLKIGKAAYGTKVYLNGKLVGEHTPNFTPGWFDVWEYLNGPGAMNELVICVGASLAQVPVNRTEGWDFEKSRYVPGIYDSVELIQTDVPYVINVQAVPDLPNRAVKALIELGNAGHVIEKRPIDVIVRETKSGNEVGKRSGNAIWNANQRTTTLEVTVPISGAHLWTPEDPFLYSLEIDTGADRSTTRFGLRTFTTHPQSGRALLNGQPYYLRGSNVCIFRFFEDATRGALPWDRQWVRALHRKFKEMHWNSLRYCIGFPPELWYEIADEEGILIQDEFPIWYGGKKDSWPKGIGADDLALEYTEWMRERWNHPSVVIWDAQNETRDDKIVAAAIGKVRGLDRSNRPWDNGWGTPQQAGDINESHPYRSSRPKYSLADFAREDGIPDNGPPPGATRPPYLINEYGWLWINRDGSLPTLTVDAYKRLAGANASVEQRRELYARHLAAKTEFWRHRRKCAGVLHFCGLGYSRPDGQTSDNFIDVKNLVFEPNFARYVADAFAPVGVMLDYWQERVEPNQPQVVPVSVINDRTSEWKGVVRFRVYRGVEFISEKQADLVVPGLGQEFVKFDWVTPTFESRYRLEATLVTKDAPPVTSLRDILVGNPPSQPKP